MSPVLFVNNVLLLKNHPRRKCRKLHCRAPTISTILKKILPKLMSSVLHVNNTQLVESHPRKENAVNTVRPWQLPRVKRKQITKIWIVSLTSSPLTSSTIYYQITYENAGAPMTSHKVSKRHSRKKCRKCCPTVAAAASRKKNTQHN